jgi:GntR family transcriptional regulator, vanillate catabolism transcriptional regulator
MRISETQTVKITNLLRDEIIKGSLAPRSRLQEELLAKQYGASRTPIRNALSTLAAEGLLIYRPNAGFSIRTFSNKDIDDAYETRASLEGTACRLLAERGINARDQEALSSCLAECTSILEKTQPLTKTEIDRYYLENRKFHTIIIDATENGYLAAAIELTRRVPFLDGTSNEPVFKEDMIPKLRRFANIDRIRVTTAEQQKILAAIVARQGTRAEALMRELVLWGRSSYLEKAERLRKSGK